MKTFHCECGHRVFFDNTSCGACGLLIGFDPVTLDMRTFGGKYQYCANARLHKICNWLVAENDPTGFCLSCGLNDVIPQLDVPDNIFLWGKLEAAKRRLLYNLLQLKLPIIATGEKPGLRFRFMEDQRRNPEVFEDFITTGHTAGTITINLMEADDVQRAEAREAMVERYRTLLGHFRHESAHYFFELLVTGAALRSEWRKLFGDETLDYADALRRYYENGPPADWPAHYVSPYATSHPHEDWAESFAHYLHIMDALETAREAGMTGSNPPGHSGWILEWMRLAVTLNELNRSLGTDDPYPFVLPAPVSEKLEFIDRLVHRPGA